MVQTDSIDYVKDIIEQATSDGSCTTIDMWKCNEILNKLRRDNELNDQNT